MEERPHAMCDTLGEDERRIATMLDDRASMDAIIAYCRTLPVRTLQRLASREIRAMATEERTHDEPAGAHVGGCGRSISP